MTVRMSWISEPLSHTDRKPHEDIADINYIGMRVSHELKHEYDSTDILIPESLSMLPRRTHEHTADINHIGMKVAHEHKHEHDSTIS